MECFCYLRPWGPSRLSKLGMAPLLASFSVGWAPFGGREDRNLDAGARFRALSLV